MYKHVFNAKFVFGTVLSLSIFLCFGFRKCIGILRSYGRQISILLLLLAELSASAAVANEAVVEPLFDSISVFKGQGADHNLKEVPGAILSGNVLWESSYFTAVGVAKANKTLGQVSEYLQESPLASLRQGYELVLLQHHGLQHNAEVGAVYSLQSPDLFVGRLGVNFKVGVGISYALGTPSYEDGAKEEPEKRYNTQQLLLFDLEWHILGVDDLSFVTRVHHRSGVYGLVAPRHVGSNFLAAGIRYNF